jgi:hypothetical protein
VDTAPAAREQAVLRAFLDAAGRLRTIPARRGKRLVVLDHLAQVFEPGVRYPEQEVGVLLRAFHPDHASLRRHLVDEGFLSRADGVYWRSGGTLTT